MAFPWIFESNFEQGDAAEWDSEEDTGSLLDVPHYSTLAAIPGGGLPYRGAYCMRIVCGDTNVHTVTEGDLDIADNATAFVSFYLFIDNNFAATVTDIFNIYEFQQGGGTVEAVISLEITATTNVVKIAIADGDAASSGFVQLTKCRWNHIEAKMKADLDDLGTLELFINGGSVQSLATLDNAAAVGSGSLGTQDTASTTTGTLLFDQFIFDDLQVYRFKRRFPQNLLCTKSQHVFVGNGRLDNITLISGDTTADNSVIVYDTDNADTNDASNIVAVLRNTATSEIVDPAGMPVLVTRGAYVEIAGTLLEAGGPHALVQIGGAQGWGSDGAIRNYAAHRTS